MFQVVESEMREHMHAIKEEVQQARVESRTVKAKKAGIPPYWILLLTMVQIRK